MPTYTELNAEACWRAQFTPPALLGLAVSLRVKYGQTGQTIASPGDNRHLNGGHRSRRWIRESRYCTNRTYTVSSADDKAGNENWYAAIDIWPGSQTELLAMCKRLDAAVRAGELEEIAAWYGNIDGDQRVDGYDNILNRLASSDSSHLTHLHITFKRRYADDPAVMARVYATLTGTVQEDDMIGFAIDDNGKLRKSIGGFTFPCTEAEMRDIRSLRDQGTLGPVSDRVHGNDASGTAFGYPVERLVDDIAKRVIELLPPGAGSGLTAEQIADAVVDEQAERLTN